MNVPCDFFIKEMGQKNWVKLYNTVKMSANHTYHSHIEKLLFSWYDYSLFSLILALSALVGVYFGFIKKQENVIDYIFGGKSMGVFPVAMSLIASEVSGVEFIGVPSDIYTYGMSFFWVILSVIFGGIITYYVYLPVFYKLQLTSSFEYLQLRFDNKNRVLATFLMCLSWILTMPATVYVPTITFSQVTNINMHLIIMLTSAVCIFYTTLGGLKAVIWTDALQFSLMCLAIITVLIFGIYESGGLSYIFQKSYEGGRIFINFDPDPTNRTAFWGPAVVSIPGMMFFLAGTQICTQKFQALPTFEHVKRAMIIFIVGLIIIKSTTTLTGLIFYTRYADCDPISSGVIKSSDMLLPYYLMDVVGTIPGLPGVFIAGIFCAALSTMSTDLNTIASIIFKDFVRPCMDENITEKHASDMIKTLVVIVGIATTAMVYLMEPLGSVYPLVSSIGGMSSGPLLAMFTLGMLVPFANSKGTFIGSIISLLFMSWIVLGAQYHNLQGGITIPQLPTSTKECNFNFNLTIADSNKYYPPWIYRISFYYYTAIGFVITMIIGVIISYITKEKTYRVDKNLISPVMHWILSKDNIELQMNNVENIR